MKKGILCTIVLAVWSMQSIHAQTPSTSQMEQLDRGLVALPSSTGKGNFVSWRLLGTDDEDATTFTLLRNGRAISAATSVYKTNYVDASGNSSTKYQVITLHHNEPVDTSEVVQAWGQVYRPITLDRPEAGPNGGTYEPNDMSVGDVDGDGQYELFVKWYPSNAKDNSQSGITDNTIIDCYRIDWSNTTGTPATRLWRIDLGRNIRSGAHYTQFMVYDFDGDGRAEMMCKTGPGSLDGAGKYVNEVATDEAIKAISGTELYRSSAGRITGGQEWLTVFRGQTGEAVHTIFYNPNRNMTYGGAADGSVNWGVGGKNDTGSYGNRGERYLAAVAYLDGPEANPSGIFCRGYYDYAFLWAVDFDGQLLHQRWLSSNKAQGSYSVTTYDADGNGTTKTYSKCKPTSGSGSGTMYQNGNHNLSVADVDGDGCDEIVWGSAALDNDGTVLYGTGFGHGDAIHLADHCPDRPGLEVFQIHEGGSYGWDLHDACTGEILYSATGDEDNGRGIAGQFDASVRGSLFWSSNDGQARSAVTGQVVSEKHGSSNFRIYWDGDLQEELFDGGKIDKWNGNGTGRVYLNGKNLYDYNNSSTCNGSKSTPCLQADILGDWREEVILWSTADNATINIFTTNSASSFRLPTLMHDHTYRLGVAWQNTAYNQPPHLGFYLPDAMLPCLVPAAKEVELVVNEPMQPVVFKARRTEFGGIDQSTYLLADGTPVNGTPAGITCDLDILDNTLTINGTPTEKGDYRLLVRLSGFDNLSATDTIAVHVVESATGIESVDFAHVATSSQSAVYDLQGRLLPTADLTRRGIYIVRRGNKAIKVRR